MTRNPRGWGRKPHRWRGRWRAYVTTGWHSDGRPIRRYVYASTQRACQERLDQARSENAGLSSTLDSTTKVQAYLATWLEQRSAEVSDRTLAIYRAEAAHVTRTIGHLRLTRLRTSDVERMMRTLVGQPVGDGRALTARAANRARGLLNAALEDAVRRDLLATNVAAKARPLRHEEAEATVWTAAEVSAFLHETAAGGAAMHALFYVALTTGLRVGELAELRRVDVDDDVLYVRNAKTKAGRRIVPLPPDTRAVLTTNRARLEADGVDTPYALASQGGRMVTRQNVRKALHRWADRAGVPPLRPHDLRHTYASMMIANGIDPASLARILGHTSPAFTLRRYVHAFERAARREAPTLGELTGASTLEGVREGVQRDLLN